jgi:hypothetical protein
MRVIFAADEHDAFAVARRELEFQFFDWLGEDGVLAGTHIALAALDFQFHHHGTLMRWPVERVHELLLEWCVPTVNFVDVAPEKLVSSLHVFFDFLVEEGLLDVERSAPVADLHVELDRHQEEFLAENADEANFGIAKFWVAQALAAGVNAHEKTELENHTQRLQWLHAPADRDHVAVLADQQAHRESTRDHRCAANCPDLTTETVEWLYATVAETTAWLAHHGNAVAAHQLTTTLTTAADPSYRAFALALLAQTGEKFPLRAV